MATDRVSSALAVLRTELNEVRSQDVQLMKQLLNLNSSIQQLTKKQKKSKSSSRNRKATLKELMRSSTMSKINEDSVTSESDDDSCSSSDEDVFKTNVKLWKYAKSVDSK
ncbi:uncharacterized protein [Mytilus edulis]|uniref:uncharacterized protein n=1 Tax=Mytilus edulis TaxID=6550 RepID=UPI0039F0BF99